MNIKRILFVVYMVVIALSVNASPIAFRRIDKNHNAGIRTVLPSLEADIDDCSIVLEVSRYTGIAHIYIYDANHTVMLCDTLQVSGKNQVVLDLSHLGNAQYSIEVVLDDGTAYRGNFEL